MMYQTVFQRYELKYFLTRRQKERALQIMASHMAPDPFGRTTVRNLYFDTDDYRMIRHSIDKPVYKEKLRIRSYEKSTPDSTVFVELKKKYRDVVYKRRLLLAEHQAMAWTCGESHSGKDSQIAREIDYCLGFYKTLHPVVFLSYEREAFFGTEETDFRVTFDEQILCRQEDLSLTSPVYGAMLLPEDTVLMELKCAGGIPLWMVRFLTSEHICKTSFSKYGTAYQRMIFPDLFGHYHQKEAIFHVRNAV